MPRSSRRPAVAEAKSDELKDSGKGLVRFDD